ncbi:MAG: hypothetical protein ACOZQL_37195 [Myxococcota bacterium]
MQSPLVDGQGRPVRLGRELGRGGEGIVFEVDDKRVAKLYLHPLEQQKSDKLEAMACLGSDAIRKFAAWPLEVLREPGKGRVQGFLMPKIMGHKPVHLLYGVQSRRSEFPAATWQHLVHAAMNAAAAFETIHRHGHVIGDVNENNVLVSPQSYLVALIDCDSFQVASGGRVFRCEVGVPLYTPPELQGKPLKDIERTLNHDRFGLAVLLFQLLFLGRHPFFGRFTGHGEMPPERAIRELRFAFGRRAVQFQMQPPPFSLPLAFLPASLVECFEQAFDRDAKRPTAETWRTGLGALLASVATCSRDSSHKYPSSQPRCPWCAFETQGGPSFFVAFQVSGGSLVFVCAPAELDELLAQLVGTAVDLNEPPQPAGQDVVPRPLPDGFDVKARRAERLRLVARGGFALVAVGVWLSVLGLSGVGWPLAGACLILWLVAQAAVSSAARTRVVGDTINARRLALSSAKDELSRRRSRWAELVANFNRAEREARQRIEVIRREFAGLQREYDAEHRRLSDDRMTSQRQAFLRSKFIANYEIRGIKAGRRAALRSYQFETALDVLVRDVEQVPGFGPKLKSTLRSWAHGLESSFKFDPSKGVSESELRLLIGKYQQRKSARRAEAQAAIVGLQRLAVESARELQQLRAEILRCEQERAQAEVDSAALDGLVVQRSSGFWWAIGGAIAAGLLVLTLPRVPMPSPAVPAAPPSAPALAEPQPIVERVAFPTTVSIPRSCTVRIEPSPSAVVVSGVRIGTSVGIGDSVSGWRRVRLSSGATGWTGPKCWLPTEQAGGACREDSDCQSERCVELVCE